MDYDNGAIGVIFKSTVSFTKTGLGAFLSRYLEAAIYQMNNENFSIFYTVQVQALNTTITIIAIIIHCDHCLHVSSTIIIIVIDASPS